MEQAVLPLKEEIADVMQLTPLKRGPGRIAKQMAHILVLPGMDDIAAVVQEFVQLVP